MTSPGTLPWTAWATPMSLVTLFRATFRPRPERLIRVTTEARTSSLRSSIQLGLPRSCTSTYLGGSSNDAAFGIAVDVTGNACVTGSTISSNFPTTPGAFDTTLDGNEDVFVTKLNATGSAPLVFSTYWAVAVPTSALGSRWTAPAPMSLASPVRTTFRPRPGRSIRPTTARTARTTSLSRNSVQAGPPR